MSAAIRSEGGPIPPHNFDPRPYNETCRVCGFRLENHLRSTYGELGTAVRQLKEAIVSELENSRWFMAFLNGLNQLAKKLGL